MHPRAHRWFCAFALLFALACERAAPSPPEASAGGANVATASSPPASPRRPLPGPVAAAGEPASLPVAATSAAPHPASAVPGLVEPRSGAGASCRVMSVSGAATRAGTPLRAGDTLDRQQPIELGASSTLHLVHTASARQWTLTGPARAFACDRGAEEVVLAYGTLRTEPGSGVRPGAEVWVGTPFGSLRYSDARAELRVTPETLRAQVSSGSVWFSSLGGEAAERELSGKTSTFTARPHRLASAAAQVRCDSDASAAEALAAALLAPSTQPLGARAREHVRARQRAHASCSSALATLLASDAVGAQDADSQAGYSALARSDRRWRSVPERASPSP